MSCVGRPAPCGLGGIVPMPLQAMDDLRQIGLQRMTRALGVNSLSDLKIPVVQHIGATLRPDGTPFHLTTLAPEVTRVDSVPDWQGAFYSYFGFATVTGTVATTTRGDTALLSATARLLFEDSDQVICEWVVRGPAPTIRPMNQIAIIEAIRIVNAGPHDEEDVRHCIALHAPQGAIGEPHSVVAMQAGVAIAALIEAVC